MERKAKLQQQKKIFTFQKGTFFKIQSGLFQGEGKRKRGGDETFSATQTSQRL